MSLINNNNAFRETEYILLSSISIVFSGFLFKSKHVFYLKYCLFMTLVCSIGFIYLQEYDVVDYEMFWKYICFVSGLSMTVLVLRSILPKKIGFIVELLFILISFIVVTVFWGYYAVTNTLFGQDTLLALLQTNVTETVEYIFSVFRINHMLLLLMASLIVVMLIKSKNSELIEDKGRIYKLISFVVLINLLLIHMTRGNFFTNIYVNAEKNLMAYNDFRSMQHDRNLKVKSLVSNNDSNGVYVLLIGESLNRNHMSAYGYNRNTNPFLDQLRNSNNVVFLENGYSCHVGTVQALTYALTSKNQYNDEELQHSLSIVDVAEAAGYDSIWISNQVKYSVYDTPISVIADASNHQLWLNSNISNPSKTNYHDMKVVDSLKSMDIKKDTFIVLHLMGSHRDYEYRYPYSFSYFGEENLLNQYDNSVRYNDYVVSEIYDYVRKLPNFQAMIYFSDHGEDVVNELGHDSNTFTWEMAKIPLVVFMSDEYIKANPEKVQILKQNYNNPFTNDLIFNLVSSLMGIKLDGMYEKNNDFISDKYDSDINRFKTLYGKKSVCD